MMKLAPANSWTFDREMQSSIHFELRRLNAAFYNANKQKSAKAEKVGEQERPDYVKKAIESYQERKKQQQMETATVDFWQSRHPDVKFTR